MKNILYFYLLLTIINSLYACSLAPQSYYFSPEKLFKSANHVVVAKAIKALKFEEFSKTLEKDYIREFVGDDHFIFEFKVIKQLKGAISNTNKIRMIGYKVEKISDFNKHKDKIFWKNGGNIFVESDCSIYGKFKVGQKYLLFLPSNQEIDEALSDISENAVETKFFRLMFGFLGNSRAFEVIKSYDDKWYKKIAGL